MHIYSFLLYIIYGEYEEIYIYDIYYESIYIYTYI